MNVGKTSIGISNSPLVAQSEASPKGGCAVDKALIRNLAMREQYRDSYWRKHDPIIGDRLLWRAQTFRHTVHLLPGETILELGCGELRLTRALLVSRGENAITAVTFQDAAPDASEIDGGVELLRLGELPGLLSGRRFDYVVAMDLLDRRNSSELLEIVYELLNPAGEIVFYESNPWNPMFQLRAGLRRLAGKKDPRNLIDRPALYELLSELGFVRIYAVFNDFVFAPLTRSLIRCGTCRSCWKMRRFCAPWQAPSLSMPRSRLAVKSCARSRLSTSLCAARSRLSFPRTMRR